MMDLDRDFPVPMDELRRASTEALLAPIRKQIDGLATKLEDEFLRELAAIGLTVVNRARFERLRSAMLGLQRVIDDPATLRAAVEHALWVLGDNGDLDPLP